MFQGSVCLLAWLRNYPQDEEASPGARWALNLWLHFTGIMSTVPCILALLSSASGKFCDFSSLSLLDVSPGPSSAQTCDAQAEGLGHFP